MMIHYGIFGYCTLFSDKPTCLPPLYLHSPLGLPRTVAFDFGSHTLGFTPALVAFSNHSWPRHGGRLAALPSDHCKPTRSTSNRVDFRECQLISFQFGLEEVGSWLSWFQGKMQDN